MTHFNSSEVFRLNQQPLFERLLADPALDAAYAWHAENTRNPLDWAAAKADLREQLASGTYAFQPLHRVRSDDGAIDQWAETDRIVLKAMTLVLEGALGKTLSPQVYHRKGGAKQAVRAVQDYLAGNPECWVMKSDVEGYYAHIDHAILYNQVAALIPDEKYLLRLVWQYLGHTVEDGGEYQDIEQGLALGCPLSPLMAALYLTPLDTVLDARGGRYVRFLDDWLAMFPSRWRLRDGAKEASRVLDGLKLATHPDKTFIGQAARGFELLGYQFTEDGPAVSEAALKCRNDRLSRLYEQGADDNRIAQYLSRWQAWTQCGAGEPVAIPRAPSRRSAYKRLGQFGAGVALGGWAGLGHAAVVNLSASDVPVGPTSANVHLDLDNDGDVDGIVEVVGTDTFNVFGPSREGLPASYDARFVVTAYSSPLSPAGGFGSTAFFQGTGTHYIGYQLNAASGPNGGHVGWFEVIYQGPNEYLVTGGAFENTPSSIHVGSYAAVPDATSFLLLDALLVPLAVVGYRRRFGARSTTVTS